MDALVELSLSNSLADLAARIRDEHEQVQAASQRGLDHAVAAGAMLAEAKARVGHGDWLDWLGGQCGITIRTAQAYMRAAREMPKLDPAKAQRVAHLSFRQAMNVMAAGPRIAAKIQAVDEAAEQNPERFGKLLDDVERTGRVEGVYRRLSNMQQADRIRAEPPPLPGGPFPVISIDPPWAYEVRKEDPSHRGITPYPPMSLDAIRALPVAELAADDAILWLWTINLLLANGTAGALLEAWGFEPRSILTWFKTDKAMTKERFGFGDWLRGSTEHCIMAVRGEPVHELQDEGTWIFAPMRAHSEKPDEFYARVESVCPAPLGGYLELFARKQRPGWVTWGDEVPATEAEAAE